MPKDKSCVREIRSRGTAVVVVLTGEIDLHHTPAVHKTLVATCEQEPTNLVINLQEVSYIDSSGIGTLVEVFRRVNAYKGKLRLCGLNEHMHNVFEITKLDHFFKIYETESEALSA